MKAHQVINGEPVTFLFSRRYWDRCCDCGLSHIIDFQPIGGGVVMTSYRDDWATKKRRKQIGRRRKR